MRLTDIIRGVKDMPDLPRMAFLPLFLGLSALAIFFSYGIWERENTRQGELRLSGPSRALAAAPIESRREGEGSYVASETGTVYYLPECSGAKRIKEASKVWFMSREDAEARGLRPAKNCVGL